MGGLFWGWWAQGRKSAADVIPHYWWEHIRSAFSPFSRLVCAFQFALLDKTNYFVMKRVEILRKGGDYLA